MLPSIRALARNVPTVAPVTNRAVISVTGSQAAEFLNGIVASSVPAHASSHFYSAFLHAQGRVLYDVFVYAQPGARGTPGYLIEHDARASDAPPLLPMLKRYVLRSKVRLRDVSDEYDVWAAWGSAREQAWETARRWAHALSGAAEPLWDSADAPPWGAEPGVLRDRRAVGMGHRLLVRKGDRPQEAATHDVADAEAYTLHRILHGVPEGVVDIPPMHAFPMDANLDVMGALDFRKGCYVGQELTVRTYHTGMLRKRTLPVAVHRSDGRLADGPLPQDRDIRAQLAALPEDAMPKPRPRGTGKLFSSVNGVGLALLRLEHVAAVEKGTASFEMETGDEKTKYNVTHWWPDWWPHTEEQAA
ncbi:Aminomethyltransferase folate-binding domain-containing protein [Wolfiporia cocos MD-104 SS10]|uniref:Aminomethyltransferase folate-binding domain-containing protein n=1 Tax=Wolfiporia cocos (strain MD-104) TaxID=742152 RepID=A0A2H3JGS8_WOLCO|nr:Aminomethyltransferase folate-binding domain-containing protein [Wolfiporia cocos MD-104 SS10]